MGNVMILDEEMAERLVMALDACVNSLEQIERLYNEARADAHANKLLTIEQACKYLSRSKATLLNYRSSGLVYYKKAKDGVWYRKSDIDKWLDSGRVNRQ